MVLPFNLNRFGTTQRKRPYYCEVEYLEASGTQYIDTGLYGTTQSQVDIIFGMTSAESGAAHNGGILGGRTAQTSNTFTMFKLASATPQYFRFDYNGQKTVATANQITWNNTSKYRFEYDSTKYLITNITTGESNTENLTPPASTTTATITLFCVNTNGTKSTYFSGRIYKYWYTDGTNTIDLVPVLDWNYTPCMYDKISGQLFYNQGTGTFQYGREIHYVDYIESTGTQYIDTGIKLTNNYSVELDYQLTQASQSRAGLFGALNMTGSNQGRFGSILSPSNSQLEHGYGAGNDYWQQGMPDTNRHKLYQKKNEIYFDENLVHTFSTATFNLVINAYLGNFVYTNYTPAKAKYYSSRWWDGDTLVRDYKPAIDENGVCFWFDRVTHTCFLNAGTGAFRYPAREIEYLQSSGTQYIDTNYAFTDNFSWEIDFEGIDDGCTLFGGRTSSIRTALLYQRNYGGIDLTTCPIAGYNGQETPFQLTDLRSGRHVIKMSVATNKGSVWVDGVQAYNEQSFTGTYISGTTQALFADKFGSGDYREQSAGKVYALKMWQTSNLVRDFIPAFQNGIAGMLDKQNNVFYTNIGTGNFGVGKVVEPEYES